MSQKVKGNVAASAAAPLPVCIPRNVVFPGGGNHALKKSQFGRNNLGQPGTRSNDSAYVLIVDGSSTAPQTLSSLSDAHVAKLGNHLSGANDAYNKFIRPLETRVLVTARKLSELQADAHGVEIKPIEPIDSVPLPMQSPELGPTSFERIDSKNLPVS